jgi:hypothetical protein
VNYADTQQQQGILDFVKSIFDPIGLMQADNLAGANSDLTMVDDARHTSKG